MSDQRGVGSRAMHVSPDRAAVVSRALESERRRVVAARDAQTLARTGPDPELAGLAEYAASLPTGP